MRHFMSVSHVDRSNARDGTILVITALILAALVAMVGVVLDGGMLISGHRQCQNAADAAATAAAADLLNGRSNSVATATATAFVQQYNSMPSATVIVNIPPTSGPHLGNSNYAEAIVNYPVATRLIQVLGGPNVRTVVARAVAGVEAANGGSGIIMALNKGARPGISSTGNGSLTVNGTVIVNSDGGGNNQFGQPINNGNSGNAISISGNGTIRATDVESVGGVNSSGNAAIQNYDSNNPSNPLVTGAAVATDPFLKLPSPTTSNGAVATNYGAIKLTGNQSVTLSPGVYTSISLSANSTATMKPGIYVITGGGLSVTGNGTVTGNGVMIYNTGSDYNVNTGLPDSGDGSSVPPAAGSATFGGVSLSGNGSVDFSPIDNAASPFNGIGLYQRRLNTEPINLSGNGSIGPFRGSLYAKWAELSLTGNGKYAAQFVVASLALSGNGAIVVDPEGQTLGTIYLVYLVE